MRKIIDFQLNIFKFVVIFNVFLAKIRFFSFKLFEIFFNKLKN